jgi:capsular polysaccharide biosynthesis protein
LSCFSFIIILASYLTKTCILVQLNSLSSPEPYNPDIDPSLRGTFDEIRIVNAAIDEAVEKLLYEAAEKVLKEDD